MQRRVSALTVSILMLLAGGAFAAEAGSATGGATTADTLSFAALAAAAEQRIDRAQAALGAALHQSEYAMQAARQLLSEQSEPAEPAEPPLSPSDELTDDDSGGVFLDEATAKAEALANQAMQESLAADQRQVQQAMAATALPFGKGLN